MKPPGFLNIRRESNSSESSAESVGVHDVIEDDLATDQNPSQRYPVPDLPLEDKIRLQAADQAAKNTEKIHYFPRDLPVYSCRSCLVPVALQNELVSKAFSGRDGRAYLMHSTVNTKLGKEEERKLLTGVHTVADLFCTSCNAILGWTYLKAQDREQAYKEGRYILEAGKIIKENNWGV